MAKDNSEANSIDSELSTPSSSGLGRRAQHRSKPYDANNVSIGIRRDTSLCPSLLSLSRLFPYFCLAAFLLSAKVESAINRGLFPALRR